ncbi:hypothetical protein ExPCM15_03585 [Escherichia coli]|nr:hypothetical protein ExPCM15_03585 [Escherichia coli]
MQEQPGERAREDPTDRQNGIAAVDQIAHGMVDRQARTDGGVVQPVTPGFFEGVVDLAIFIAVACSCQFVGTDDVETVAGEIKILVSELLAGGNVQHH